MLIYCEKKILLAGVSLVLEKNTVRWMQRTNRVGRSGYRRAVTVIKESELSSVLLGLHGGTVAFVKATDRSRASISPAQSLKRIIVFAFAARRPESSFK